jgi:hypothetical protein
VGDPGPLLHRARRVFLPLPAGGEGAPEAAASAGRPCRPALRHLRARVRRPGHGALPGLPGGDLLPVLHAGRALRRPVQAAPGPTWTRAWATSCS